MSGHPVSVSDRADAAQFKHELLSRLGLRDDANNQDFENAHDVLVEFLELAPRKVNSWAEARTADMDEAFALLSGPERRLILASQRAARIQSRLDETPEGHTPALASLTAPAAPAAGKPRRKHLVWAIVPLLLFAVVLGVLYMGKSSEVPPISGTPTVRKTAAADGAATPVDPKNQVALHALGAGQFNLGNAVEAKRQWLIAAKLYPKNAEVHYDLGILYFSQTPPDTARMTAEWKMVIAIDPSSELAKTVASRLKSSSPGASATPSAK